MCRQLTEFFQNPRYRINKFLLSLNGQWSYQVKFKRTFLVAVTFWFFFLGFFGQIRNIVVHWDNWLTILPTIGPLLVDIACLIKICNSFYFADKIRQLLERIYDDWHAPMGPEEKILAQFAEEGRLFTITYTVCLYTSTVFYLTLSTVLYVLMVNGWANITTATVFPIPIYLCANQEDHYIFFQFSICLGILIILTIPVAVDSMFVVLIQHGCGMFAAISYRLEYLIDREDLQVDLHPRLIADKTFWVMVDCIKKHKEAIEYADSLISVYSWSFASMLALNMLTMSFTGLQVMTATTPDSLTEALRQFVFGSAQLLHLFFENFFCQKLTDQSLQVSIAVTRSKWYLCSMRTRFLLKFVLMRSAEPWEMKAGKLFNMSMANFSAVLRTSLSYLTILGSMTTL